MSVTAEWAAKWPNYCRSCEGCGAQCWETVPGMDPDVDDCEDCVKKSACPRCAEKALGKPGETPCSSCGWVEGDIADGTGFSLNLV